MLNLRCALRGFTATALILLAASVSTKAQSNVHRLSARPSSTEARFALPGSMTARPSSSVRLGRLDGRTQLNGMSLILKRTPEQEATLAQLLHDQQDSTSPRFHHWLTPQEFGSQFGLFDQDLNLISNWLQGLGFSIQEIAPSRNRITFSGAASVIESAFSLTMDRYSRDGQTFSENSAPVQLPASLASVVSGVTGLSSYRLTANNKVRSLPAATSVAPLYNSQPTGPAVHYLVPWDFRQIFDMNTLINSGSDGTGIAIGVIGQSAVDTTQLTYFQQKTGQTAKLPAMVLVPGTGASNKVQGDEDESELDLEYAGGTAPGASVQFIYTGCTSISSSSALSGSTNCQNDGVFAALSYAITHSVAPILTLSYGGCEANFAGSAVATLEPLLQQANAQGQTVLVSSGDTGAASCDRTSPSATIASHGLAVSYPASSPYVIGVGGTQLSNVGGWATTNNSYGGSAPGYIPEGVWNDTAVYGSLAASGGGASKVFPKPDWQVGSGVPSDGQRDVPDVAFPASSVTIPYLVCIASESCQNISGFGNAPTGQTNGGLVGGTSVSAPNFAAMLAVVEQATGGGALGNINPMLYAIAQGSSASAVFHDTGSGSNIVPCLPGTADCPATSTVIDPTLGYRAGGGYDQATGLGSISASGLKAALSAKILPIQLTASTISPVIAQPVTFTAKILADNPAPTGTVTFAIGGTTIGSAISLMNGVATYTYSGYQRPGYAAVSATYSGDSIYGSSSSTLNISATQVPVSVKINVSSATPQINTPIALTLAASGSYGTPTGSVTLAVDNIYVANGVSPLPLTNGVATYPYAGFSSAGLHTITATYWSEADTYNFGIKPVPPAFVVPYTAYEGGSATLNVQVTSPTQTLTPSVTITGVPTGPIAPSDMVSLKINISGSGSAPAGSYSYSIDSGTSYISAVRTGPMSLDLSPPAGWSPGNHTVRVIYNGDNNYLPSAPVTVSFTVLTPSFTLSTSSSTLTVPNGGTGSITLTLNSSPTYSDPTSIKLALLSSTGAAFSGCYSLSTLQLSPSAEGAAASATLTMASGAAHCTSGQNIVQPMQSESTSVLPATAFLFAFAGLLGGLAFRRRLHQIRLLVALFSLMMLFAAGCSGGTTSSNGNAPTTGGTGTPSNALTGTYVIQVIGSSTQHSYRTASTTFTLIVQ